MPRFLERKLQKRYGKKSKIPYKIMNSLGYMKGNKETAKGRAASAKHKKDVRTAKRKGISVKAADSRRNRRKHRIANAHRYRR